MRNALKAASEVGLWMFGYISVGVVLGFVFGDDMFGPEFVFGIILLMGNEIRKRLNAEEALERERALANAVSILPKKG